nr:MAG TPA: MIOREX complex component 7 [Caudoviricetes sp.]
MTRRQEKICLRLFHRQTFHRFVTRTHMLVSGTGWLKSLVIEITFLLNQFN